MERRYKGVSEEVQGVCEGEFGRLIDKEERGNGNGVRGVKVERMGDHGCTCTNVECL